MRQGEHRKKIDLMNNFLARYNIRHNWVADCLGVSLGTFNSWISRNTTPSSVAEDLNSIIVKSGKELKKFKFKNKDIKSEFEYCLENFGIKRYYFANYLGITHGAISNRIRHGYEFTDTDIAALNQALQEQIQARLNFSFPALSIRQTDVETEQLSA